MHYCADHVRFYIATAVSGNEQVPLKYNISNSDWDERIRKVSLVLGE